MINAAGYGRALFQLAQDNRTDDRIRQELELVRTALRQEPSYITLLDTPAVPKAEKLTLVREAFGGVAQELLSFLCILCEQRSMCSFFACADEFDRCYDEAHDLLRATAVTAVPMTDAQKTALTQRLAAMTGKQVILHNRVEPGVLGGVRLDYDGQRLDDTVSHHLDAVRELLSKTVL